MTADLSSHGLMGEELFAQHVRCACPSKLCNNPRAVKLCGSLHKLCKFHRKKANTNQKRLQQRRRVIRAQMAERASSGGSTAAHFSTLAMTVNLVDFLKNELQPSTTVTMANKNDAPFTISNGKLSIFDASFLDNFMFVGTTTTTTTTSQATPTGYYDNCSSDHVQGKYEVFNFELRL